MAKLTEEQQEVWDRLNYQWQPGDPVTGDLIYDIESGNMYMWTGHEWELATCASYQNKKS
jgi:hypothetical protein